MANRTFLLALACASGLGCLPAFANSAQAAQFALDFDNDANGNAASLSDLGVSVGNWQNPGSVQREDYVISDQWLADFGVSIDAYAKPGDYNKRNNWEYDRSVAASDLSSQDLVLFNTDADYYSKNTLKKGSFDKDLLTGDDYGTDPQGNVLIIQNQSKNWHKPNDSARGGLISFSFDEAVNLSNIDLLDVDDYGSRGKQIIFTAYGEEKDEQGNDVVLNTWRFDETALESGQVEQLSDGEGDNSLYRFNFDETQVKRFDVLYPGSGAIAGLKWETPEEAPEETPEPASVLGLLAVAGLGMRLKRFLTA